ncbi:MAG: LysM peptidoglycan-binding domain-containing protein [Bacteroidia bacterium]
MKQVLSRMLIAGAMALPVCVNASVPGDSVGVKVVNGKSYVLYKIAKGDNLGRISKEYGVSVANLEEINSIQGANIQVGQVLMVPSRGAAKGLSLQNMSGSTASGGTTQPAPKPVTASPTAPAPKPAPTADQNPSSSGRKQHTVAKGETLYAVSRKYSVTVDQIRQWNSLSADGLKEGQKLWVSESGTAQVTKPVETVKPVEPEVIKPKPEENPVVAKPAESATVKPLVEGGGDQNATKVKTSPGIHVVKPGETLFAIARTYGMDVSELRKINRLENTSIKEGQALRVKADGNENPNQGTSLIEAISSVQDSTPKLEQYPDLKVLTAPKATTVPTTATVSVYKDKSTGISYKRIEESGKVGTIQDFATDQTRFYAFHRYLPTGSYIRVNYPQKGQSILVEVINQLPENDPYVVRLSAKSLEYLMIREAGEEVRLRYVIPLGE